MSWELIIPGIAAGLSLLAIGIELLMHDREKAKEIEFAIRRKQREVKQHQKEKNTKAMMDANKDLMGLMSKNFKLRMRTMFISLPLFIIIFWLLSGMLSLAPLTAGQASQVGLDVRNMQQSPLNLQVELVSSGVQVSGTNARTLELDDKGDNGDRQQLWWNVTAAAGAQEYSIKFTSANKSDSKTYSVNFVPAGSLSAGFSPASAYKLLSDTVEATPLYKPVEVNVFGMNLSWFWYYFVSYLILGALLSPVKNHLLWGHHKGVKHLEKLDREKKA